MTNEVIKKENVRRKTKDNVSFEKNYRDEDKIAKKYYYDSLRLPNRVLKYFHFCDR